MKTYPQELKDRLTARMLAPYNESITALARETQIPKDTLYGWRVGALGRIHRTRPTEPTSSAALNSDDKFAIVVETARLNEYELGEYCRHRGLYVQQVQAWQERCSAANAAMPNRAGQDRSREQAREIRELRGELQRKDPALAEAAALLLLQKKVQARWGAGEGANSISRNGSK